MRKAVKEDKYICCDETYHKILIKAGENGAPPTANILDFNYTAPSKYQLLTIVGFLQQLYLCTNMVVNEVYYTINLISACKYPH